MLIANISQFRKDLKFYIDSVTDNHDTLIVNGNGKTIIVMSLDDYNATIETQYLLSTEANRKMMNKSMQELKEDKTVIKTMEELHEMINDK
jgi:antitoxin YefM